VAALFTDHPDCFAPSSMAPGWLGEYVSGWHGDERERPL
jgi:hypothetical protein